MVLINLEDKIMSKTLKYWSLIEPSERDNMVRK